MAGSDMEQIAGARRDAIEEVGGKRGGSSTAMVTFPDAFRRRVESFPSPLKLEVEETAENMSPRNVWQEDGGEIITAGIERTHAKWSTYFVTMVPGAAAGMI